MSKLFNNNDIPLPLVPQEPDDDDDTKRNFSSFKLNTVAGNKKKDEKKKKMTNADTHIVGVFRALDPL